MRLLIRLLAATLALAAPVRAAELVPLLRLEVLGGQFFYEKQHTSFSGNGNLLFTPAVKFSERDSLVPTLSSQYRRTREVRELIGGGFLTEESLDTLLAVKWVHQLTEAWSLKPGVNFKNELITESEEEKLGKGLFDYNKFGGGVELERRGERWNLRPALNAYRVRYYRYHALAAGQEELGAEINSGDRVLDFDAYDASLSVDFLASERTLLNASALASLRPFTEQNLVTESGEYAPRKRLDAYLVGLLGAQQKLPDWSVAGRKIESVAGLSLAYTQSISNQNNYDASRTRFNPYYYDYGELAAGPSLGLRVAQKLGMTLGYEFARRRYLDRPAQTEDGNYSATGEKIHLHTHTVSWQLSYPIAWGLGLKASGSYRRSSSNMSYEKTYKYNYQSAHYFVGLSYSL